MMKLLVVVLLLPSYCAATFYHRWLDSLNKEKGHVDLITILEGMDMTCVLRGASSGEACGTLEDSQGEPCRYCPMGPEYGICVSSGMGEHINKANIPHLQCGISVNAEKEEDSAFYNELVGCGSGGVTGAECISSTANCAWCVSKEPRFGVCYSQAFVEAAKSYDINAWDSLFECTQDSSNSDELLRVGALADEKCVLEGMPEDPDEDLEVQCQSTSDSAGKHCIGVTLLDYWELCLTETQKSFFEFLVNRLGEDGLDERLDLLEMLDGEGPVLGGDGLGDFDLDDDFEADDADEQVEIVNNDDAGDGDDTDNEDVTGNTAEIVDDDEVDNADDSDNADDFAGVNEVHVPEVVSGEMDEVIKNSYEMDEEAGQ